MRILFEKKKKISELKSFFYSRYQLQMNFQRRNDETLSSGSNSVPKGQVLPGEALSSSNKEKEVLRYDVPAFPELYILNSPL